jgi:hypothetical protein
MELWLSHDPLIFVSDCCSVEVQIKVCTAVSRIAKFLVAIVTCIEQLPAESNAVVIDNVSM